MVPWRYESFTGYLKAGEQTGEVGAVCQEVSYAAMKWAALTTLSGGNLEFRLSSLNRDESWLHNLHFSNQLVSLGNHLHSYSIYSSQNSNS